MKRMIDNKEFDALVKDVKDVKQEAIEIPKAKDKGMYFALEEPTENEGVYTYSKLTISNINPDIPLKVGDLIMSFDSTDPSDIKSANMWIIDEVDGDSIKVVLVGKVGGSGKQLYQHIITLSHTDSLWVDLINDSAEPINTKAKFIEWLVANHYDSEHSGFYVNFKLITQATTYPVYRIRYNNSSQKIEGYYYAGASTGGYWTNIVESVSTQADQVRAL